MENNQTPLILKIGYKPCLRMYHFYYSQAIIINILRSGCMDVPFYGVQSLSIGKRWKDRAGKLDLFLLETLPEGGQS